MLKMTQHTSIVAGMDVSKAHLDVYLHPDGSHRRFANDKTGWRALHKWLPANTSLQSIVYEATGPYHKGAERYLAAHGLPIARLGPRPVPGTSPKRLASTPRRTRSMRASWRNSAPSLNPQYAPCPDRRSNSSRN